MKSYIPFSIAIILGMGTWSWHSVDEKNCLFLYQTHCYTCDEEDIFFVGTPENCAVCPHRISHYVDWDGKSIWGCTKNIEKDFELPQVSTNVCPRNYPLKDILGHCYKCTASDAVQINNNTEMTCQGKRYITNYRNSKKSILCPDLKQIQDPYICISCQGKWQNEECNSISFTPMNFCQKNLDCKPTQWCYPFPYSVYSKSGICRPITPNKWIFSDLDGYTFATAETFCMRQDAHIPSIEELENNAELLLSIIPKTKIWIIFDEGSLYLDSLKTPFPITREKEFLESGGDNTHALCVKN